MVTETVILSHQGGVLVADVPSGVFHTAVSLEPGTVFFEAKAGPYLPLAEAETAAWAPPEGSGEAAAVSGTAAIVAGILTPALQ